MVAGESDIRFEGDIVAAADHRWQAPYPISGVRRVGDTVVLLYDHMSGPRHHQFRNLECFTLDGRRLWTAEHATTETADSYVESLNEDGLVARSFAGYVCTLDPATGRLLSKRFTK